MYYRDMDKSEIRKMIKRKLEELDQDYINDNSKKIIQRLYGLAWFMDYESYLIYVSLEKEVQTINLIKKLMSRNKNIILPKLVWENMIIVKIGSIDELMRWRYWVMEPKGLSRYDWLIDVWLIPWLAFGKDRWRIWRWKWYFDRLLCENLMKKIWLCFGFQLFEKIPKQSHDVDMDMIVYEWWLIYW